MKKLTQIDWRPLIVVGLVALCWALAAGIGFAGEEGGKPKMKAQPYVLPYMLVLLCIGLGVFLVCFTSKRRDRPLGAPQFKDETAALLEGKKEVPVMMIGMRDAKVDGMLGKPKIKRRGDQIFAEAAQSGQLSDEEAAKIHCIYEHPAGRYEIVFLDRHVVQIKKQPSAAKPPEE